MFRLEKVFQNDDQFFIFNSNILKTFSIYFLIYLFSVLENYSIYEILNYKVYENSNYFIFSFSTPIIFYFLSLILFKSHNNFYYYDRNIIKKDFGCLFLSLLFSILIIKFYTNENINSNFIILFLLLFINLYFFQKLINKIYFLLVKKNIIQKNILIIGNYESVKKILDEKKHDIYVYKCCMIVDKSKGEIKKIRSEIRIPIFDTDEDVRSLLEYHSLGQIWIVNDDKINLDKTLKIVTKYSVDIIILYLFKKENNKNLINSKYHFENFEISRFHGVSLFYKIILDKILSLIFLLILSPAILLSVILIYLEDGFPIFFSQDRTGWDGRRFKIYKIRSLKNIKFKKTDQVVSGDERLLKIGKFIRRFSIDEVPQFYNVLKGDMSIVGPRPHMVEHDIYYSNMLKYFLKRHKTNPGLTGWAQIHGLRGPTNDFQLMKKRMELDLWYLNNWSLYLDLKIILKTFLAIFKYKGT